MAEEVPILEVQVYNGWYRGLLVSWNTLAGICWRGGEGGLSYHVVDGGTRDSWWVERLKGRGVSWDWVGCSCLSARRRRMTVDMYS